MNSTTYPRRNKPGASLTVREIDVLEAAAEGLTSEEIGEKLGMSKRTADFHLGNIFGKLEVANRLQAVNEARERKLIK